MATDKELAFRKRLSEDFAFWAENFCTIRVKKGEFQKFKLNRVQRDLLAAITQQEKDTGGLIRVVVLKARQQGLSTFVSAYNYWRLSHRPARKGMVVAQHDKTTRAMFDMYRRIHDDLPDQLRPSTKYKSKNELTFAALDTGIMVATAGGGAMARGETITDAHLSEVAFWPPAHAEANLNAVDQSIPTDPESNSTVFVESTANGISGPYYELWINAVKGKNGYLPFFAPWFHSEDHRDFNFPDGKEALAADLCDEEKLLQEKYGLDLAQLNFRRKKMAGPGGAKKFKQEYPATPEEAFLSSGAPVFDPDRLVERLEEIRKEKPLLRKMALRGTTFTPCDWGDLSVFRELDPNGTYWIGADVALGTPDGDYSVAQVLDEEKRQVAVWRGKCNPRDFAVILMHLGHYFNDALIAVERNMHGYGVLSDLQHKLEYWNLYTAIKDGQVSEVETKNLGFYTNKESKAQIIGGLSQSIFEKDITINDITTLEELMTFVEVSKDVYGADTGKHDDTVMSLAIVNHIHDGRWEPISFGREYYN